MGIGVVKRTMIKKGKKVYYGYKGHIGVDRATGLIHHASFTAANLHDSQELDNLLIGREGRFLLIRLTILRFGSGPVRRKGCFMVSRRKGDGIAV